MTEYIKRSRCRKKFINDDEHFQTDFGYNRLNIRYQNCVKCRTCNRETTEYRKGVKQQMETDGNYDPNRNKKQIERIKKKNRLLMTGVYVICVAKQ